MNNRPILLLVMVMMMIYTSVYVTIWVCMPLTHSLTHSGGLCVRMLRHPEVFSECDSFATHRLSYKMKCRHSDPDVTHLAMNVATR